MPAGKYSMKEETGLDHEGLCSMHRALGSHGWCGGERPPCLCPVLCAGGRTDSEPVPLAWHLPSDGGESAHSETVADP